MGGGPGADLPAPGVVSGMSSAVLVVAKAALAALTDEKARKRLGWAVAAVLAPVILVLVFICSLASGAAGHNTSVVDLCFRGGEIPPEVPAEYRAYIREIRDSFSVLDALVSSVNAQTDGEKQVDGVRVKAVFHALFFGEAQPGGRAAATFVDCFVIYETRTRTATTTDEEGNEVETEEEYTVAVPIEDLAVVWANVRSMMGVEVSDEVQSNAEAVYSLIRYGWADAGWEGAWGDTGVPVLSVDGFCSPLGARWRSMVTSEFGWRTCPYHGRELHAGLDMAAPSGTPIRAALAGTVVKSTYHSSYGNYTVIDHGNGMTTGYAHQSRRLVSVGDRVEAGEVIGLVGSTGNSTGNHLHLEVRFNGSLQDPRNYLP